jgi:hypothetical protein
MNIRLNAETDSGFDLSLRVVTSEHAVQIRARLANGQYMLQT